MGPWEVIGGWEGPRGEGGGWLGPRVKARGWEGPRGEGGGWAGPRGEGEGWEGPRGEGGGWEGPRGEGWKGPRSALDWSRALSLAGLCNNLFKTPRLYNYSKDLGMDSTQLKKELA